MGMLSTAVPHNYNQLIHNLQPRSDDVVKQNSGRTSSRDEEVVPSNTVQRAGNTNTVGSPIYSHHNHILQKKSNDAASGKSDCTSSKDEVKEDNSHRFGLRGLGDVLNGRNSNVTTLAVGADLETLSVYDNMYSTQNFPWSARIPNPPPQYNLPRCYLGHQVPRLNVSFI